MSYEYHITRAESWADSENNPIGRLEWERVAAAHPALAELGTVNWLDVGDEKIFGIEGRNTSFSWRLGRVDITGKYGDPFRALAAELADSLKARVMGDDD